MSGERSLEERTSNELTPTAVNRLAAPDLGYVICPCEGEKIPKLPRHKKPCGKRYLCGGRVQCPEGMYEECKDVKDLENES